MRRRCAPALAAAAALLLVPAGCGGSLDDEKVESAIRSGVDARLKKAGTTGRVRSVTCPEDRPLKQGDTFTCRATFSDGSSATVDARQTSDDGDVSWNVRRSR
jgi:hypothetical protein